MSAMLKIVHSPSLYYAASPSTIIRSNSVVVEARPWSHMMSKQPNVGLSNVTAEHSLGKGAVVKRKRGRPKKQTEASLGGTWKRRRCTHTAGVD